jgi:ribosomal protein L24
VISGNHKGKSGKVLKVFVDRQRVIVEGCRLSQEAHEAESEKPPGRYYQPGGTDSCVQCHGYLSTYG